MKFLLYPAGELRWIRSGTLRGIAYMQTFVILTYYNKLTLIDNFHECNLDYYKIAIYYSIIP
jgi:hypothetical protein